jgi:hypothetical protein
MNHSDSILAVLMNHSDSILAVLMNHSDRKKLIRFLH